MSAVVQELAVRPDFALGDFMRLFMLDEDLAVRAGGQWPSLRREAVVVVAG